MRNLLTGLMVLVSTFSVAASEESDVYILWYSPGPKWDETLAYDDQPGVRGHTEYLMGLYDANILLLGGALNDRPGEMVVIQVASRAHADKIATRDPAVINQTLSVKVTGWSLEMSAMRKFRRTVPQISDPYKPFRLERENPDSPINIKDQ